MGLIFQSYIILYSFISQILTLSIIPPRAHLQKTIIGKSIYPFSDFFKRLTLPILELLAIESLILEPPSFMVALKAPESLFCTELSAPNVALRFIFWH